MSKLTRLSVLLLILALLASCGSSGQAEDPAPQEEPAAADTTVPEDPAPTDTPSPEPEAAEPEPTDPPAEAAADAEAAAEATTEPAGEEPEDGPRTASFAIVPEESSAGYSIQEVFISDNNTLATAVGVTSIITGGLTLNYDDVTASEFEPFVVDISALTSDRSRRDRAIRRQWLESSTYPLARFEVSEVRGFPADPQEGEALSFQLAGDMTVKETTIEAVWDVTATLEGDRLTGSATFDTFLADFDIPVPSIAGVLRVTDGITLRLDFVMQRTEE